MQQLEQGCGIYGWGRVKRYAGRMETINEEATRRLEALKFWGKHGMEATQDFYKVSRRTLFRWKHLYQTSASLIAIIAVFLWLAKLSTASSCRAAHGKVGFSFGG